MRFDDQFAIVLELVNACVRSGQAGPVLGPQVRAQADRLWQLAPAASEDQTRARLVLGVLHFIRFDGAPSPAADPSDLALSLGYLLPLADVDTGDQLPELVRSLMPGPNADPRMQANVAGMLHRHADQADDRLACDVAVALLCEALASPASGQERHQWLTTLAAACGTSFLLTGDPADLDATIGIGHELLETLPDDDPRVPVVQANLGAHYGLRFDLSNAPADLDEAIGYGEQGLSGGTPPGSVYGDVGTSYLMRFGIGGAVSDRDRGVELLESAVSRSPDVPPYAMRLALARFRRWHTESGTPDDLHRVIELGAHVPHEDPLYPTMRDLITCARFLLLDEADLIRDPSSYITAGRAALDTLAPGDPGAAAITMLLCHGYLVRAEQSGEPADQDALIEWTTAALTRFDPDPSSQRPAGPAATGPSQPALTASRDTDLADPVPTLRAVLGKAHLDRFARSGEAADADRAVEYGAQAPYLNQALVARFKVRQDLADLDRAIAGTDSAQTLSLMRLHAARFRHSGASADLSRAVDLGEKALAETPADADDRLRLLTQISQIAQLGCEYSNDASLRASLLPAAVTAAVQAVQALPPDHPNPAEVLAVAAGAYRLRYVTTQDPGDIDRAIALGLLAAARDSPQRAEILAGLGGSWHCRFDVTGDIDSLRRAAQTAREALAALGPDEPRRARFLQNLAYACRDLARLKPSEVDRGILDEAIPADAAPPSERAHAHQALGSLALILGDTATAVRQLDAAVILLPTLTPRHHNWVDRRSRLGAHTGLAGEVIAAHLAAGDPAGAVVMADEARSVLLVNRMNLRRDLDALEREHPALAVELHRIDERLAGGSVPPTATAMSPNGTAASGTAMAAAWRKRDDVVAQIRSTPGFQTFQAATPVDPRRVPAGGTVVVLTATADRSDAILLTADCEPRAVALPGLREKDVLERAGMLLAADEGTSLIGRLRRRQAYAGMLAWLWDTVVAPVAEAVSTDRVWWLPVGWLGLLPIHAAGHPGRAGALDRFVSSYLPTLRALDAHHPVAVPRRQMVVSLPQTPGLAELPSTAAEAAHLHRARPESSLLTGPDATVAAVVAALPNSTWVHFAGHAEAEVAGSGEAGLHLRDGLLTMSRIGALNLHDAELAYLSACSTGHRGVYSDEPLSLATAFHMAGFRHVIASLWPLDDEIAAVASRAFYRECDSADDAAAALHRAVVAMRAARPDRPDLWAALIHSGR